uniref:Uncharacterized protein n=1 Tax=Anguilla anguilla TaxID=7936 RepID=A0A0E9T857_ANGAN
MYNNSLIRD